MTWQESERHRNTEINGGKKKFKTEKRMCFCLNQWGYHQRQRLLASLQHIIPYLGSSMRRVGLFFPLHTNDNIRSHYLTPQQVRFDPSKGTCQLIPFFSFDETLDNSVNGNLELLQSLSDEAAGFILSLWVFGQTSLTPLFLTAWTGGSTLWSRLGEGSGSEAKNRIPSLCHFHVFHVVWLISYRKW